MEQYPSTSVPGIKPTPRDNGTGGFRVNLDEIAAANALAPKLDVSSFAAAAGAGQAIGKGLQGLAGGLDSIAQDQFESINRRKVDEAGAKLTAANDDIASLIANEQDETKWPALFEKEAAKWDGELLNDKSLSPAAREAIATKISGWRITTLSNVRRTAFNRSIQKEQEGLEGARIMAIQGGNFDEAERLTAEQEKRGLIGKDIAARQRVQAGNAKEVAAKQSKVDAHNTDRARFNEVLEQDPWEAAKAVEEGSFPNFDAADRMNAKADAERAIARLQQDKKEEARNMIVEGFAGEADIDVVAGVAKLGAEQTASLKEFRKQWLANKASDEPFDWNKAAALQAEIKSYDPDSYKTQADAATAYESLVMRADLLSATGGEVGQKTGGTWSQVLYQKHPYHDKRPTGQDAEAKKAFSQLLDLYDDDGAFGEKTRQVKVKKKQMKDGAETEVESFEDAPNPDAARFRIKAEQRYAPLFLKDVKEGRLDPQDIDAADKWMRSKLSWLKQGEKIRAALSPSGPDPTLFPPVGGVDPEQKLNSIVP